MSEMRGSNKRCAVVAAGHQFGACTELQQLTQGCGIVGYRGYGHRIVAIALKRTIEEVQVGDRTMRVKSVQRPCGRRTAKAEIDDAANEVGSAARARLRRQAEELVLGRDPDARGTTERPK